MTFCINCGSQEAPSSKYCSSCGTLLQNSKTAGFERTLASGADVHATKLRTGPVEAATSEAEGPQLPPGIDASSAWLLDPIYRATGVRVTLTQFVWVIITLLFLVSWISYAATQPSDISSASRSKPSTTYVRAGGWICGSPQYAIGYARLSQFGPETAYKGYDGCSQMGSVTPVEILERTTFAGTPIVNIGNQFGSGWTIERDLR